MEVLHLNCTVEILGNDGWVMMIWWDKKMNLHIFLDVRGQFVCVCPCCNNWVCSSIIYWSVNIGNKYNCLHIKSLDPNRWHVEEWRYRTDTHCVGIYHRMMHTGISTIYWMAYLWTYMCFSISLSVNIVICPPGGKQCGWCLFCSVWLKQLHSLAVLIRKSCTCLAPLL